jgi:CRP-like cAMP-binding protein
MDEERIKLLQRMAIFGGIDTAIVQLVLEQSAIVVVAAGERFFRENERGHSMFVLERGRVQIAKQCSGREVVLCELAAGDCFGEMALIDMCPRSASVQALEECTAIEVSGGTLLAVYKRSLEQFTMIQMNMGREVSRRLRVADKLLLQARVDGRLAADAYPFRCV